MRSHTPVTVNLIGVIIALISVLLAIPVRGQTLTTLHSFVGYPSDGSIPTGRLVMDAQGDLYGTTVWGGVGTCPNGTPYNPYGCGTVFKLAADGTESVLYSFGGYANDGLHPSGLVTDAVGNLYGTNSNGGPSGGACGYYNYYGEYGCGSVFRLSPGGTESVLHNFYSPLNLSIRVPWLTDGASPNSGVIMDAQGNLYGTTVWGGILGGVCGRDGCGTVFKVTPTGSENVLYGFLGGAGGSYPNASLIMDAKGNLYGTTYYGGNPSQSCLPGGCGTVFKVTPAGAETVLYRFSGADGANPFSGLVIDATGNLYGTTTWGGFYGGDCFVYGCGTVFKLTPDGTETVIYRFTDIPNVSPAGPLVMDATGNLYGTAGNSVFKIATTGTESVLYNFSGGADGSYPEVSLIDVQGNLYGVAGNGGTGGNCYGGCGTLFKLIP